MDSSELFETLARATWLTLGRGRHRRMPLGEDALTSVNLYALGSPGVGVVVDYPELTAALLGCDFELWVGAEEAGWSRYAIVTRKLGRSTGRYAGLNRLVGGRKQMDALEEYASRNRAAALYCFYSHADEPYTWNCPLREEQEQLGCSVTPLAVMRLALRTPGGRSFSWVHARPETLPWRCLVRCPLLTARDPGTTHPGWPEHAGHYHVELPASLRTRLDSAAAQPRVDDPELFSDRTPLRPARVAVVRVGTPAPNSPS